MHTNRQRHVEKSNSRTAEILTGPLNEKALLKGIERLGKYAHKSHIPSIT